MVARGLSIVQLHERLLGRKGFFQPDKADTWVAFDGEIVGVYLAVWGSTPVVRIVALDPESGMIADVALKHSTISKPEGRDDE